MPEGERALASDLAGFLLILALALTLALGLEGDFRMFGAVRTAIGFAPAEGKLRVGRIANRPFAHGVTQRQDCRRFPVGHRRHMAEMTLMLAEDAPGLVVTGAANNGVGIPSCVRSGTEAAAAVSDRLG